MHLQLKSPILVPIESIYHDSVYLYTNFWLRNLAKKIYRLPIFHFNDTPCHAETFSEIHSYGIEIQNAYNGSHLLVLWCKLFLGVLN